MKIINKLNPSRTTDIFKLSPNQKILCEKLPAPGQSLNVVILAATRITRHRFARKSGKNFFETLETMGKNPATTRGTAIKMNKNIFHS